jgi:pilus assembly protein Flp/PilA
MSLFTKFLKEESGASAAEYVLLLAIIGAGIIAGVTYLGTSINTALTAAGDALTDVVPADAT